MKRLAIIGGNSLIARSFNRKFKDLIDIHCFARKPLKEEGVNYYQVNWNSLSQEQINALGEADYILYCIGETNGSNKTLTKINIHLLDKITTYLKSHQKIIFISSIALKFNESFYSFTKMEGERIIKENFKNYLILRPSMLYGSGDRKNLKKIKDLLRFLPIIPVLKPDVLIQPLFVEDLTNLIHEAIRTDTFPNKAYSLAGPKQLPTKTILKIICDKEGYKRLFISISLTKIQQIFKVLKMIFPFGVPLYYQIQNLKSHPEISCDEAKRELSFYQSKFEEGYLSF